MTNLLLEFANEQVKRLKEVKASEIPHFSVGDTVSVKYKITEGTTTRIQAFVGIVIAKTKNASNYNASFTVRKISSGVGVERKFMVYSPLLAGVEVLKQGVVRRAKLYYLRELTGKAARIKEKTDFYSKEKGESKPKKEAKKSEKKEG